MSTSLRNLTMDTRLFPSDVVRVSFADDNGWIAGYGFTRNFPNVYARLRQTALFLPVSPDTSGNGASVAVVDCEMLQPVAARDLLSALNAAAGYSVQVTTLERLQGNATELDSQAASARDGSGSADAERAAAAVTASNEVSSNSFFQHAADSLGTTLSAVKWLAILAVVVILIFLASSARQKASAILS